jgi:hypothetical protein
LTAPQLSTIAFVLTSRPERYIKQLVSHFGNKVKTELTEEGGRLQFDFGVCDLKAAPTGIELIGTAEDAAQLETLKDVVGRHLVRFGMNDELAVLWTP